MKRWISMIIAVAMIVMLVPAMAFSASAETSGAYEYQMVDEDTIEITGYAGLKTGEKLEEQQAQAAAGATEETEAATDAEATDEATGEESTEATQAQSAEEEALTAEIIAIPSELDGYKVVSIARNAFKDCCVPTTFIIPEGVTTIGRDAFAGCTALETVYIPDTVTTIERGAFKMCSKLKSVTIPASVTKIEKETFFACNYLSTVVIPDTVTEIAKGAFTGCDNVVISGSYGSVAETYANENDLIFQEYQSFFAANRQAILIVSGVVLGIALIVVAYVLYRKHQTKQMKKEFAEDRASRANG